MTDAEAAGNAVEIVLEFASKWADAKHRDRDALAEAEPVVRAIVDGVAALAKEECENGIEAIGETCSQSSPGDDVDEGGYRFEHWCGPCIAKALIATTPAPGAGEQEEGT